MADQVVGRMLQQSRRLRLIAKLMNRDITPSTPGLNADDLCALHDLLSESADLFDAAIHAAQTMKGGA